MPSAAAQAHLDAADAAMRTYDFAGAAESVAKAYAEDPDDLDINLAYLQRYPMRRYRFTGTTIDIDDREVAAAEAEAFRAELLARYRDLAETRPSEAKWHYLLAELAGKDVDAQELHLAACLAVDPAFSRAYALRGLLAQRRGDNAAHRADLRRVAELRPDDGGAAFSAAFAETGAARVVALLDYVDRFPGHERNAQALSEAAGDTDEADERIVLLRRAVAAAGTEGPMAAHLGGMLLEEVAARDLAGAADAAGELGPAFAGHAAALRALAAAEEALAADDATRALAALDEVPSPSPVGEARAVAIRALTLAAAGDEGEARATLVQRLASEPTEDLWALASRLGGRSAIEGDVWNARLAAAKDAPDFDLPLATGGRVSLSGRKGSVTLVNFWYPGCGPCRNEYRHLAPQLAPFADRPFDVVAINTIAAEDDLVEPFMSGNGYPFVATLCDEAVTEAYGVRGTPSNFLVDHEGRIVAQPRIHSRATAAAVALLIEETVARAERAG